MNNLILSYSGGSGGFLLLHLMLLSNQYHTKFKTDWNLDQIINYQWSICYPSSWKNTEIWPDNEILETSDVYPKMYFLCAPDLIDQLFIEQSIYKNNKKLTVYTDINSQIELSKYKNAHWFAKPYLIKYRRLVKEWQQHYNNIKDPSWPKYLSFKGFEKSSHIKEEMLENPYTIAILSKKDQLKKEAETLSYRDLKKLDKDIRDEAVFYNNEKIYEPAQRLINDADYVVRLQDLVNSNGQILVDLNLIEQVNEDQIALIKLWKKLHSTELLQKINIIG